MSDEREGAEPTNNYLRPWREYRGLTQAFVEERLGWRSSRLYELESGKAVCSDDVLEALATVYNPPTAADLLRPPPAHGPRLRRRRRARLPTGSPLAFDKLADARMMLLQLAEEFAKLRADILPRFDQFEQHLRDAERKASEAVGDATLLADMFEAHAKQLRRAGIEPGESAPEPPQKP